MAFLYNCTCGVAIYDWTKSHRCMPRFEVMRDEEHSRRDDYWIPIHASDAETAAEKFADRYDCEDGDYLIISGRVSDFAVLVRDSAGSVTRWTITGESVPTYYGHQDHTYEHEQANCPATSTGTVKT